MQKTDPSKKVTTTQDFTVETAERLYYLFKVFPVAPKELPLPFLLGASGTIGRAADIGNTITILDPLMSRRHAEYRRCCPGPYEISDCRSKNGLFVDGIRVERCLIGDGAVVRAGGTIFVLREVGLDLPEPLSPDERLVAFSPSFRRTVESCGKVAETRTSVVLQGDTGTGKELLARYIHDRSGRKGKFVPVNCAAITAGLFESAMFGHRKGAFTGATGDFTGYARTAHGGTLFLDEVGELPAEVQAKFLRFLESGEVATLGEVAPVTVDVRVVAATNKNLHEAVEKGTFRRDLYARLAQWVIEIPPLSTRPEDVLLLAQRGLFPARLTPEAAELLVLYEWPFNVRELLAVINELKIKYPGLSSVSPAMLPEAIRSSKAARRLRSPIVPDRETLECLLRECDGNVSEVARRLQRDRRQVYRWLERYGLRNSK